MPFLMCVDGMQSSWITVAQFMDLKVRAKGEGDIRRPSYKPLRHAKMLLE